MLLGQAVTVWTTKFETLHVFFFSMFSPCIFKVNHFYWPTNALNCIKLKRLKSTCINILKKQLKTPTCFGTFGIHPQGVLKVLH